MPDPAVSIIIPVYNSAKTIAKTLQVIVSQYFAFRAEIIVIDDGSVDGTPQIVQSFPQVKYIRQENSGPATARNRGAQESTGEYLFFTDSDCIPKSDWLKKMMPHFQNPSVAVVAGSYGIANPQNSLAQCIHQEILYRHRRMPQYPGCFGSFNFAIRRKMFIEVGGFDPSYRDASGEDNDLSYKIVGRGHKIYFAKDALVDHFHTEDLRKYLREQCRHGFWRAKMYLAHPAMSRGDDYTFWKDILEIPMVLLLVVLIGLSLWKRFLAIDPIYLLAFTLLLEICCGFVIIKNCKLGLFWACVMFLRAFARSWGFVTGAGYFLWSKILPK